MHQPQPSGSQRPLPKPPNQHVRAACPHSHHHDKHCKMMNQHQHSPTQCNYTWQDGGHSAYPGKMQQCSCYMPNEYHQAVQDYLPYHPYSAFISVNPHQKRIQLTNESPLSISHKSQCQTHYAGSNQPFYHQLSHNHPPPPPHHHQGLQQHYHHQHHFHLHNADNSYQMHSQAQLQKHAAICSCHSKAPRHLLHQQMSLQASTHYQQYHYRFHQKRPTDEGDKIKRSRDGWDYELSQDLQAKQIEMLKRKYGGDTKASRAARIIQQAYRRYSLDKNFAKLKLEVDKRRLSRRFNEAGRSRTIWVDACGAASAYPQYLSSNTKAKMPGQLGHGEITKENVQWNQHGAYPVPQTHQSVSISVSGERTIRKEDKVVSNHDAQNFEEYNTMKKGSQHQMYLSEHSGISKGLFCRPSTNYDHLANEPYPSLHQDPMGLDNNDYDNELVAELPPIEDVLDDEAFEHPSDVVPEETSKVNESIFRSLSSQDHQAQVAGSCRQAQNDSDGASSPHRNLRTWNSLGRGDAIKGGNEMKSFSSPVWKRKLVPGESGEEYGRCQDVEPPVVAQESYVVHVPPPHSKNEPSHFGQHSNFSNRPRVTDKQRKRTYRIGLNLFNKLVIFVVEDLILIVMVLLYHLNVR